MSCYPGRCRGLHGIDDRVGGGRGERACRGGEGTVAWPKVQAGVPGGPGCRTRPEFEAGPGAMNRTEGNSSAGGRASRHALVGVIVVLAVSIAILMGLGSQAPAPRPGPEEPEPFQPPSDPAGSHLARTGAQATPQPRSASEREPGTAPGPGDRDQGHSAADRSTDASNSPHGSKPGRGEIPPRDRDTAQAGEEPRPGDATVFVLDAAGAPIPDASVMRRGSDGGATSAPCNEAGRAVLKDVPMRVSKSGPASAA